MNKRRKERKHKPAEDRSLPIRQGIRLALVGGDSPLDEKGTDDGMVPAQFDGEAQSARRIGPLTPDEVKRGDYAVGRAELVKRIKEGITTLVAAKRTTAAIRRNLGKWFSELADTYGGELKRAVSEFAKQHSPGQMPSYSTIQSWVKFYHDFQDTPDDELPVTRAAAREANPAWRWDRESEDESDSTATVDMTREPTKPVARRTQRTSDARPDSEDRKLAGRNGHVDADDNHNPDDNRATVAEDDTDILDNDDCESASDDQQTRYGKYLGFIEAVVAYAEDVGWAEAREVFDRLEAHGFALEEI